MPNDSSFLAFMTGSRAGRKVVAGLLFFGGSIGLFAGVLLGAESAYALLLSVFSSKGKSRDLIRYVSTVNMIVVGLVFTILLRNVDLGALLPWVNYVLHYLMPITIVLDWLLSPPVSRLDSRNILLALAFPAAYLAYVIVRGADTGWYPYPFLDPAKVGGYGGVATYSLGIAATFVLAAWVLPALGNRIHRT